MIKKEDNNDLFKVLDKFTSKTAFDESDFLELAKFVKDVFDLKTHKDPGLKIMQDLTNVVIRNQEKMPTLTESQLKAALASFFISSMDTIFKRNNYTIAQKIDYVDRFITFMFIRLFPEAEIKEILKEIRRIKKNDI